MKITLTGKRDVIRNKADFDDHFVCTNRGSAHGIWINWEKASEMTEQEFITLTYNIYRSLKD